MKSKRAGSGMSDRVRIGVYKGWAIDAELLKDVGLWRTTCRSKRDATVINVPALATTLNGAKLVALIHISAWLAGHDLGLKSRRNRRRPGRTLRQKTKSRSALGSGGNLTP